jgi:hypothetical protein
MSITRTTAETGVLAQLITLIPQMAVTGSIMHYLDRPEQLSGQQIQQKHPRGILLVQYDESAGEARTESMVIAIICIAFTPQKVIKLGDAVREALNDWQIPGATRIEFHDDKASGYEAGLFSRVVRFRCNTPAVPSNGSNRAAAIAALNL